MKDAEFRDYLQGLLKIIDEIEVKKSGKLTLNSLHSNDLDLGQAEIVDRLDGLYFVECRDNCGACMDVFGDGLVFARNQINQYLNGNLTSPTKVLNFSYFNQKLNESMSVLVYFVSKKLVVVSGVPEVTETLRNKLVIQSANRVEDLVVPKKLINFTLMGAPNLHTAFREEL